MSKENNKNILSLEEALKKAIEHSQSSKRNFIESIDIAVVLGIDPKQSDQNVKGSLVLPNGSGKKIRALVFTASDEVKKQAQDSGAEFVGLEDLISKIEEGFTGFDTCIATPDVMPKIGKIARKLGPRGLMPSPKNGTITNDVKKAVEDALKGRIDFKNDKSGIVHCLIGKSNFEFDSLLSNLRSVIKAIKDAKPESSKGKYIKNLYINSTMGPSFEVNTQML